MNLENLIGQLLIVGFEGDSIKTDSPVFSDIVKNNLGGVILFDRFLSKKSDNHNIRSPAQVVKLTSQLQNLANTPLLIAVDQEGGMVSRFKARRGFPETAPAEQLGSDPTGSKTEKASQQTAEMLGQMGFNLNFSPVVDLNSFPENPIIGKYNRSFSNDPKTVIQHAKIWITAHRDKKIITCLKHFPGHGSAQTDSHLGFVDISDSWNETELVPFKHLIEHDFADSIMTGHLYNMHLDEAHPATLSHETITGLLRAKLGFDGLVFSDDMQMKGITDRYGLEESICMALNSGVDVLVFGNNLVYDPDIVSKTIDTILQAVRSGKISEERIRSALERVARIKKSLNQSY